MLLFSPYPLSLSRISVKWAFYDCNLGTPTQYETLDALVDVCLSKYFVLNDDNVMLGAPYEIGVIHKTAHQDNLKTPGEN